jgi:type IV fimbrial biogenesis protein FimT
MEDRRSVGRIAVGCGTISASAAGPRGGLARSAVAAAQEQRFSLRTVQQPNGRGPERGFTATELLVALAIAGLLMSLAVPGFASLTRSVGLSSAANELMAALHTARAAAVLRGTPVAVCLTADDSTCLAAPDAAASGWLVFVSDGAVATPRPAVVREVLSRFQLPDRLTVSASRPTVTFWPVARAGSTSTFDLCDLGGAGRSIIVSQTGRPRVAAEATSCA